MGKYLHARRGSGEEQGIKLYKQYQPCEMKITHRKKKKKLLEGNTPKHLDGGGGSLFYTSQIFCTEHDCFCNSSNKLYF